MKPSSFQTAIRLQFDCLVKRVIDTTVKDYQRELSRRATHEIAFSELPEQELNHVGITDDYDSDYSCFEVLGTKVSYPWDIEIIAHQITPFTVMAVQSTGSLYIKRI